MKIVSFLMVCLSMAGLSVSAAEKGEHQLSDWKIGKVLFGERHSKASLKGKVVILEHWGVRCPPCIALLPHMAKMDKDHRKEGLVIIGAESQGHEKSDIKPVIEKAGVEYTITEGAEGPIEFSSLPRCFVFDTTGALIYDGYPSGAEFESKVKDALKAASSSEAEVAGGKEEKKLLFEMSNWTNAEGVQIRAAVKRATKDEVVFLLPSGKEAKVAMEKLSEASRKKIEEELPAEKDDEV